MKITSRIDAEDLDLQRLREIIEAVTDGAIAEGSEVEPGETLGDLVDQVDIVCVSMMETIDICGAKLNDLFDENEQLSMHLSKTDDALNALYNVMAEGVDYDEDLDHATIDMMEAFVASGASEPTFDGELSFQENIVISKEDFKPIVRQAIESWLRLKMSQVAIR